MSSLHVLTILTATACLLAATAPRAAAEELDAGWVEDEGTWAFEYPDDRFTDDALLDLRSLNESKSGMRGFIRLSSDGNGFVRGDGQPIRFWSVVGYGWRKSPQEMDRNARFLAKLGVNMIRIHANIAPKGDGQKITDVNRDEINKILRFVKSCKDAGIYLTISPYWYHHKMPASWAPALPGWKEGDMPSGSLFFSEPYQHAYKLWTKALYTTVNPHTGLAIKDDPTVAIIQVKNEDSLLFYTSQRLPREQQLILSKQFGQWLKRQYGSIDKAIAHWDGVKIDEGQGNAVAGVGDELAKGVVGMYLVWELTQDRTGGLAKRLDDQLHFTAWRMRKFYDDMQRFFTQELGCKQLTNAMNWKSADKMKLDDAERWSYAGLDVIAVNRYTGGAHTGENNGYRIDPGHLLTNVSILRNPLQMPTNLKQVVGHPMIITESSWVKPNLFRSEGGLMTAAYMSLTGVDSLYWFAQGETDYLKDPRRKFWSVKKGERGYALEKWSCATPMLQGMFPANALIYRQGYLEQGDVVVHEHRTVDSIWKRQDPIIAETETFDPNRDTEDLRDQTGAKTDVSRLAFLVGPVEVEFADKPGQSRVADLSRFIDGQARTVRANTGQIELNYGVGLLKVDAPKAQGVAGFLAEAGGKFELSDVTIESTDPYASVEVVSMDDQDISRSGKLLIQVGTLCRPTGWETEPAPDGARRIVWTGRPPYLVKDTDTTITIANTSVNQATLLDPAGYPVEEVHLNASGRDRSITLPPNTMYLILH